MTKSFNWLQVLRILGILLLIEAGFMLLSAIISIIYHERDLWCIVASAAFTAIVGLFGFFSGHRSRNQIGTREGYLIVGLVWIIFSFFGMMPFVLSDSITTITDAFFETMSGFTTTGATILTDIDHMPKGLLFWRSLMQWIGGMGIIVFSMAILPVFGSGMQVYKAEVPGPTYDKMMPRIKDTARILWAIYLVLTFSEFLLLCLARMNWFDAICHSLTTVATGGFSTKQASVGYWSSPAIHYIIIFFMLISSLNFTLIYNAIFKQQVKRLFADEEVLAFLKVIGFVTIYLLIGLLINTHVSGVKGVELSFRQSLFHTIAIITTSGFCTTDYIAWPPMLWVMLILITCSGGCAGSTSGGIKVIRLHLAAKNIFYEFRRIIHPKAIMPVRYNHRMVPDNVVNNIHVFLAIFLILTTLSTIILIALGMTPIEAFGAALSCISNVGPALGSLGPAGSYAAVPMLGKWTLAFTMLIGRLELFTILLLFAPSFWKR